MLRVLVIMIGLLISQLAYPNVDGQKSDYETEFLRKAEAQIRVILEKYCRDACEFLQAEAELEENLDHIEDLGFENLEGIHSPAVTFKPKKLWTRVQIDARVDLKNRDRLYRILQGHLASLAPIVEIIWVELFVPEIGKENTVRARIIRNLEDKLTNLTGDLFAKYCPETCLVNRVKVKGETLTEEQTQSLDASEYYFDRDENAWLRIDQASLHVTMSEIMPELERSQIIQMLQEQVSFLAKARVEPRMVRFPETFASRRQRIENESQDPYGLDKLKKTLSLFKEMSASNNSNQTAPASSTELEPINIVPMSENSNMSKYLLAAVVIIIIGGLVMLVVSRYGAVEREAKMMRQSAEMQRQNFQNAPFRDEKEEEKEEEKARRLELDENLVHKIKASDLKDEIMEIVTRNPKVAREGFGRMLTEDGVEETSKYIHVLGNGVVFDLLKDPVHRRNLRDLSEYYHKSTFDLTPEDVVRLLTKLKTKILASELRVMTRTDLEAFEFLSQMDSPQIFNLISDEKSRIQAVVLGQLPSAKRRQVFELFKGESRVGLMNELCEQGSITKDYLVNVAKTLNRKVASRGGFDPETARSGDILLELLERVGIDEQKNLIRNLENSNPDGARNIKMRLITTYTLAYVKSGALLEIILEMEHGDLVTFLAGAPEEIAKLVIDQAPSELADALLEELANISNVDESHYRLVELKVLSKLRGMVNAGRVNLYEINEFMFSERNSMLAMNTKHSTSPTAKGAA
jgi:flagellar motor switch protein FliG